MAKAATKKAAKPDASEGGEAAPRTSVPVSAGPKLPPVAWVQ